MLYRLGLCFVVALASTSCGADDADPPAPKVAVAADTSWFLNGGDLNAASTLADWRAATTEGRLASAADLLKMKVSDLPAPAQAIDMARELEGKITNAAESGEDGYLGPVVERIVSEMNW